MHYNRHGRFVPLSEHYVRVCDTEGGADVCVPCGPNAYLDDPTDSNFVFDCLEKNCGEGRYNLTYRTFMYRTRRLAMFIFLFGGDR